MWFQHCACVLVHPSHPVGYTTDDLQFMWQTGDPVQMDAIALPQFDIRQEDIDYGNCTKFYSGTGIAAVQISDIFLRGSYKNAH